MIGTSFFERVSFYADYRAAAETRSFTATRSADGDQSDVANPCVTWKEYDLVQTIHQAFPPRDDLEKFDNRANRFANCF
jgi:hypothetical protein